MVFEYWSFGNAAAVLQLLNGIAAIMAPTSGIVGAAKVAALLGFLMVVIGAALKNDPMPVMSWMLGLAIGWYALFVPRVTMVVYDTSPVGSTAGYTVDNVPLGLGFVASAGSKFSRWLTQTGETVFSLPEGAKFTNAGLLRPQKIMLASSGYSMPNATLDSDWQAFFHECTYYDINIYSKRLGLAGFVTEESLRAATDPLGELGKTNKVLFVNIVTGGQATRTCDEAYSILKTATDNLASQPAILSRYAKQAFPGLSDADAQSAYNQAMSDANQILYNNSLSTVETVKNRWMVNLLRMRDTRSAISSGNTAAAMVEFGIIQAENQRLNAYLQSARAAQDTIPTMRNIIEAVMIGLFPVTLIIMIFVGYGGLRLFAEWAMLYFSLQLWGFCYALMNLIMISKNANNIYSIASDAATTYVSLGNVGGIVEEISADMAMAGQVAWAIPLICYGLVRGLGASGASMARSMAGPAQSSAEQVGSSQGAGNNTMGVANYSKVSDSGTVSHGTGAGVDTFYSGFSGSSANPVMHQGYISRAATSANSSLIAGAALGMAARQTSQLAEQQSTAAEALRQSALVSTLSHALNRQDTTGIEKAWGEQGRGSFTQGQQATQSIANDVMRATEAGQKESLDLMVKAGLGSGNLTPVKLEAAIGKKYGSDAALKFRQSQSGKESEDAKSSNEFSDAFATDDRARQSVTGGTADSKAIEGRFQESASLKEQSQATLQQSQALEQQASAARRGDASVSHDLIAANPRLAQAISNTVSSPDFKAAGAVGDYPAQIGQIQNAMANAGLDPKALASLVQVPQPGGVPALPSQFANGDAVPTRGDLQSGYTGAAGAIRQSGEHAIAENHARAPKVNVGGPDISGMQKKVEAGQKEIQGKVAAGQQTVQGGQAVVKSSAEANLPQYVEQPDGSMSLRVPQSQLAQVSKNLGHDAAVTGGAIAGAAGQVIEGVANAGSAVAQASTAAAPEPVRSFITASPNYFQVNQPTSVKYDAGNENPAVKNIPK